MAEFAFEDASRFIARLTWVELPHIGVFRMRVTAPRVGYIGLPSNNPLVKPLTACVQHQLAVMQLFAADDQRRCE